MSNSVELRAVQEQAALWRALIESAGWSQLKKVMEEQRASRIFTVGEVPLQSFAQALPQEFMKGEAAGIGLVLTLPYVQMEVLQAEMKVLEVKLEQEKEDEATDAASNAGESRVELSGGNSAFGE